MTDQIELLRAIQAQPDDDILRLAYADWIEENRPHEPNTEATCEFIRVSCGLRKVSPQMPPSAYKWLEAHWQRLVPRVMALHVPSPPNTVVLFYGNPPQPAPAWGGPLWSRSGRNVWCKIRLKGAGRRAGSPEAVFARSLRLVFWKGLLSSAMMFSDWGWKIIKESLLLDQPSLALPNTMNFGHTLATAPRSDRADSVVPVPK